MALPTHIYETYIRSTNEQVWEAITNPDLTRLYFHHTAFTSDLQPGSTHRYILPDGKNAVTGTVEQVERPNRLVITWQVQYDPDMSKEPASRVEWTTHAANEAGTVTRLVVRHCDLEMSPLTSENVARGWIPILQSMKSLLETGESLGDLDPGELDEPIGTPHRELAARANGETWELLTKQAPTADDITEMIERANTSAYHWRRAVGEDDPVQARSAWLLARVYTVSGDALAAMRHARRCAELTELGKGMADFDEVYAHEALARANALAGNTEAAAKHHRIATSIELADPADAEIVSQDLAAEPWFGFTPSPG